MSRVGKLLIAHPNLPRDNPWSKRVIYVFADNANEGTQGIIMNHPTRYTVNDFIAGRGFDLPLTKEKIRIGGPVNNKALFVLHTSEWYSSSTIVIDNSFSISSDDFMIEKLAMDNQPFFWRMCLGMCAWAPGQLDSELAGEFPYRAENSWLIADADYSIMFDYDAEKQWESALELSKKQSVNSWL